MLFYTGITRQASEIAQSYASKSNLNGERISHIVKLVDEALAVLKSGSNLDDFGNLLHSAWMEKRMLSDVVSNSNIDEIYNEGIASGALGGKLCGAGAGGFMLFFVPPDRRSSVRKRLSRLIHVPIKFEPTGSTIIFSSVEPQCVVD